MSHVFVLVWYVIKNNNFNKSIFCYILNYSVQLEDIFLIFPVVSIIIQKNWKQKNEQEIGQIFTIWILDVKAVKENLF